MSQPASTNIAVRRDFTPSIIRQGVRNKDPWACRFSNEYQYRNIINVEKERHLPQDVLTLKQMELRDDIHLGYGTSINWIRHRGMPAYRLGKSLLFVSESEYKDWLEENKHLLPQSALRHALQAVPLTADPGETKTPPEKEEVQVQTEETKPEAELEPLKPKRIKPVGSSGITLPRELMLDIQAYATKHNILVEEAVTELLKDSLALQRVSVILTRSR